jgi:hypothetical protein
VTPFSAVTSPNFLVMFLISILLIVITPLNHLYNLIPADIQFFRFRQKRLHVVSRKVLKFLPILLCSAERKKAVRSFLGIHSVESKT